MNEDINYWRQEASVARGYAQQLECEVNRLQSLRAEVEALRDCRTCRHYTTASGGCMSVLQCIDANAYQRATPIRIWQGAARAEKGPADA